jgi:hypothetical protein
MHVQRLKEEWHASDAEEQDTYQRWGIEGAITSQDKLVDILNFMSYIYLRRQKQAESLQGNPVSIDAIRRMFMKLQTIYTEFSKPQISQRDVFPQLARQRDASYSLSTLYGEFDKVQSELSKYILESKLKDLSRASLAHAAT